MTNENELSTATNTSVNETGAAAPVTPAPSTAQENVAADATGNTAAQPDTATTVPVNTPVAGASMNADITGVNTPNGVIGVPTSAVAMPADSAPLTTADAHAATIVNPAPAASNAPTVTPVNTVDTAGNAPTVNMGAVADNVNTVSMGARVNSADHAYNVGFEHGHAAGSEAVADGTVPPVIPPTGDGVAAAGGDGDGAAPAGAFVKAADKGNRHDVLGYVITGVATCLLTLGLCAGMMSSGAFTKSSGSELASIGATTSKSTDGNSSGSGSSSNASTVDWSEVASKVESSVVSIIVSANNVTAQGSGAIIGDDGTIVTNAHVIDGAQVIQVTLSDGTIYNADLVGSDPSTDIAVIKIENLPDSVDLTPVTFADSDDVVQGEPIMSIGSPLGYDNTITSGIVSAVDRPVSISVNGTTVSMNAIQIDSSINQGNSGGPTFNVDGEVIGINSSIASVTGDSESAGSVGIGFAIPSNLVKKITDEIITDGEVQHVLLGVSVRDGSATVDDVTRAGVTVVSVTDDSSADDAGIKAGDVIVAYDGTAVQSAEALIGNVRAASPGDTAEITIVRDGKIQKVTVTYSADDETSSSTEEDKQSSSSNSGNSNSNSGGLLDRITPQSK